MFSYRALILVFTALLLSQVLYSQQQHQSILDRYVEEGLRNNLALRAKQVDFNMSTEELNEAQGKFFPSLTLHTRYTFAGGGRFLELPVGDLLNPVYATLNLPASVENEKLFFVPTREHETRIRLTQPLWIPAVHFNMLIKSDLRDITMMEVSVFKRYLASEIKKAYYNHLKSVSVVQVYRKMKEVLEENLRVSEKLVLSGKATEDVIYRAKAELAEIEQKIALAEKNRSVSASYFNVLLNRPPYSGIEILDESDRVFDVPVKLEEALEHALNTREELQIFKERLTIQENAIGLAKSAHLPEISAAIDYGFQGPDYSFTVDDDFWSASVVMQWKLFNGLQSRARLRKADHREKKLLLMQEELQDRIGMEVRTAFNDLDVVRENIVFSGEALISLGKSFEILSKKYEQGMATQLEYLDAQSNLTSAELQRLISQYDFLIAYAHFEYVANLTKKDVIANPGG
jgi:outer membrane protein TolC